MKRMALLVATAAIAAATALPAAAHGPQGRDRDGYGDHHGFDGDGWGMMEMMHRFAEGGGPGMMGRDDDWRGMMGPGMMGWGPGMMQGAGPTGPGLLGGMGHFGMTGRMFDTVDSDGDGAISADEARAAHTARLQEFDADGDGTLSIDEFEQLHSAAIRELMVDRFQYLDADGDGKVTQDEMAAPIDRMSRFMRMQERFGPGYDDDEDDDGRPRPRMDPDDMPGMGNGGMRNN